MKPTLETVADYLLALLIVIGLVWTLDLMVFGFHAPGLFT